MCVLLSQIKCLIVLFWHKYIHRDICATHLLHHWSRFAPSHAPDIAYAASVNQCHKLSAGRAAAAFLCKVCSQLGSDLDFHYPQVWWHESGCLAFQKADCLASSVCRSTVLQKDQIKNSPETSHITGSSCSVSSTSGQYLPVILITGSTNIWFVGNPSHLKFLSPTGLPHDNGTGLDLLRSSFYF